MTLSLPFSLLHTEHEGNSGQRIFRRVRGRCGILLNVIEQSPVKQKEFFFRLINPVTVIQVKEGKRLEAGKSIREIRFDIFHSVN